MSHILFLLSVCLCFSDPSVMCSKDRKTDLFHYPICCSRRDRQTGHFHCPVCPRHVLVRPLTTPNPTSANTIWFTTAHVTPLFLFIGYLSTSTCSAFLVVQLLVLTSVPGAVLNVWEYWLLKLFYRFTAELKLIHFHDCDNNAGTRQLLNRTRNERPTRIHVNDIKQESSQQTQYCDRPVSP